MVENHRYISMMAATFLEYSELMDCMTHISVSDDVQEAQAGSPLVGSNSLGLSALKTAIQVKGQHKYLNDCL